MSTYRVHPTEPTLIYRGEQYIGVMFTAEDAALTVEALNGREHDVEHEKSFIARVSARYHDAAAAAIAADSCTCSHLPGGADPACPIHQGRRARGPKPPPLGPGCICDGSGRTCPRHGAVM